MEPAGMTQGHKVFSQLSSEEESLGPGAQNSNEKPLHLLPTFLWENSALDLNITHQYDHIY